jgi:hypothetical protein
MSKEEKHLVRRDPTGHLNPDYQRELLELSGHKKTLDPNAFINTPNTRDEFAEAFGEGAVLAMTSGAEVDQQLFDQIVIEEWGGPFILTPARTEFASGPDADDIPKAELSAFPKG